MGYRFTNEKVNLSWYEVYICLRSNAARCAIVNKTADEIIGCVYLLNINCINLCTNFYAMIGEKNNHGQGAGKYDIALLLRHGFFNLNLQRIQLAVLANNEAAIALYTKVGFKKERIKRQAIYKNGEYIDEVLMGLLRHEYRKT